MKIVLMLLRLINALRIKTVFVSNKHLKRVKINDVHFSLMKRCENKYSLF